MEVNELSYAFLPMFVYVLNYMTLAINFISFIKVFSEIKHNQGSSFLILNMFIVVGLILVNTFSQISHYEVYFVWKIHIPNSATVMRFADRYTMFFVALCANIKCQEFIFDSMKKYFDHKKLNS